MATVIPGGFISQASPAQQNIGAQIASARDSGLSRQASAVEADKRRAQESSVMFLKNAQDQASQLGVSASYIMQQNPEMYQGALATLMGGDTTRMQESWKQLDSAPRSAAQAINEAMLQGVEKLRQEDYDLLDKESRKQVTEYIQKADTKISAEEIEKKIQQLAGEKQFTAIAEQMGIEPEGYSPEGIPIWPKEFKDWRNEIIEQLQPDEREWTDPSNKWQDITPEERDEFWGALQSGQLKDIINFSVEDEKYKAMERIMLQKEGETNRQDRIVSASNVGGDLLPWETGLSSGAQRETGVPEPYETTKEVRDRLAPAEGPATSPGAPIDYGVQERTIPGEPVKSTRTETTIDKGFVSRVQDLATGVREQAPTVMTTPMQDYLQISDAEATTRYKNAQIHMIDAQLKAIGQGDPDKLSQQAQYLYDRMGAEYETFLDAQKDFIARGDKLKEEDVQRWNEYIRITADKYKMNPVEMKASETNFLGFTKRGLAGLPILTLPGIMGTGNMGANLGGGASYADPKASADALYQNILKQ